MDEIVQRTIEHLYERLKYLEGTIATLEKLAARPVKQRSPRGRKGMGAAERVEVSERMKKYWANRRNRGSSR
jgi:hypothetical protein